MNYQTEGEEMPKAMHESFESSARTRCDVCQAQAYTMATRSDAKSELLFCIHHRKKHYDSLLDEGWTVIDDLGSMESFVPPETLSV